MEYPHLPMSATLSLGLLSQGCSIALWIVTKKMQGREPPRVGELSWVGFAGHRMTYCKSWDWRLIITWADIVWKKGQFWVIDVLICVCKRMWLSWRWTQVRVHSFVSVCMPVCVLPQPPSPQHLHTQNSMTTQRALGPVATYHHGTQSSVTGVLDRWTSIPRVNRYEMEEINDYHGHWLDLVESRANLLIFLLSPLFSLHDQNKYKHKPSFHQSTTASCSLLITSGFISPPPCSPQAGEHSSFSSVPMGTQ